MPCCCKKLCKDCSDKCDDYDTRCPFCRAPAVKSNAEVVRLLQQHVDKGNALAQSMLGEAYSQGHYDLKKSSKRAFELYELSAAQGHAGGQQALGLSYLEGLGVKIDYKAAVLWYRRAAQQGYANAQYNLGVIFFEGMGVAQSDVEAVRWFRLAAAQGEPEALFNLGVCHANGLGVPQDYREALRLWKRAAAKGHTGAAVAIQRLEAMRSMQLTA